MRLRSFLALSLFLPPLAAGAIVVDTAEDVVGDDDRCSLREAIENVNEGAAVHDDCGTGDTITFDDSLAGATIVLNGEQLLLTGSVTIEGPVPGDPGSLTLDGNEASRILEISGEVTVTVQDVTFTRGHTAEGPTARRGGGGIKVHQGAEVLLRRTRIVGNTTAYAGNHGGGVFVQNASLEVVDSEISNNRTTVSVAHGGGIAVQDGTLVVRRSLLTNNRSDTNSGGGIYLAGTEALIVNSTLSNNAATSGSAFTATYFNRGSDFAASSVRLVHTTIAFNETHNTSGAQSIHISSRTLDEKATLEVINSLLVLDSSDKRICNLNAVNVTWVDSFATFVGCGGPATPIAELRVGPLADNGGPTRTHALGFGSVALDAAGDCVAEHGLDTDQRGTPRPGGDSEACDAGAFEMQEPPPTADLQLAVESNRAHPNVGETVELTVTARNHGPDDAPLVVVQTAVAEGLEVQSVETEHGDFDETTGVWTPGDLAHGQEVALKFVVKLTQVHDYVFTASIAAAVYDPQPDDNERSFRLYLPPAQLVVDTLEDVIADDGKCSLREAVLNANGNDQSGSVDCDAGRDADEITFDASLAGEALVLQQGELVISDDLVLAGPEEGRFDGVILDGNEETRLVRVDPHLRVELRDLTLARGSSSTNGGALHLSGGVHAHLARVRVTGNQVTGSSAQAGGIYANEQSHLELEDCEIDGNNAAGSSSKAGGIGMVNGTLVLVRTLVHANRSNDEGGGIYTARSQVHAQNSTFSANVASRGGGALFLHQSQAELVFVTFANNRGSARDERAITLDMSGTETQPTTVELVGSLVVQEQGGRACSLGSEHAVINARDTLAIDESCTGAATDPELLVLGELCDNGGLTRTHALAPDSTARAASEQCPVDHDQRGLPRGETCDLGAFQTQSDEDFVAECPEPEEPEEEEGEEQEEEEQEEPEEEQEEPEEEQEEPEVENGGCGCRQGTADASILLLLGLGVWLAPRRRAVRG